MTFFATILMIRGINYYCFYANKFCVFFRINRQDIKKYKVHFFIMLVFYQLKKLFYCKKTVFVLPKASNSQRTVNF